jgi:2-polyprenyl-3-methyl-5-hydroxy-6-metoxy-1,4-benzoquinol methylase
MPGGNRSLGLSDIPERPDLSAFRKKAAELSEGVSNDGVYGAIERLVADVGGSGDVLDFGAGTGQLTKRLVASGRFRAVSGADLYPKPSDMPAGINWIVGDLNDRIPVADASFDLVIGAEVIEHLENPRAVCREIFRLLRPGGRVLLSTPNNESWRSVIALLVRGHFVAFGETAYPAHITALTRADLRRALTESGFRDVVFSFTDVGGIPGMPERTWGSVLGPLARGLRFSDNVLVVARKSSEKA